MNKEFCASVNFLLGIHSASFLLRFALLCLNLCVACDRKEMVVSGYIYQVAHVQFCSSHDNCAALFLFMALSKREDKNS